MNLLNFVLKIISVVEADLQIVKVSLSNLDSISLYRSRSKSLNETAATIATLIDLSKATLITGDFNVCLMQSPANIVTTSLKKLGFKQLIDEATHILGNKDSLTLQLH